MRASLVCFSCVLLVSLMMQAGNVAAAGRQTPDFAAVRQAAEQGIQEVVAMFNNHCVAAKGKTSQAAKGKTSQAAKGKLSQDERKRLQAEIDRLVESSNALGALR